MGDTCSLQCPDYFHPPLNDLVYKSIRSSFIYTNRDCEILKSQTHKPLPKNGESKPKHPGNKLNSV